MLEKLQNALRRAFGNLSPDPESREAMWAFVNKVMSTYHFTPEAQQWLRANINLRVDDLTSTRGGGYWMPSTREVRLFTAQDEAAVHELAHAWWHGRRHPLKDEMIEATVRLSAAKNPA